VPLTSFQEQLGRLLSANRSEDSYLAGAAAILAAPNTTLYSQDLDYFQDTPERVATAFVSDQRTLVAGGYTVATELTQPATSCGSGQGS
jgi:hypothetical protein